ncbi:hypothetical protein L1987_66223 [Smallanthus sonchifolius]|uniref:Uncharacterized protein n=1 Tax=Smallanthus sonchifolius TaxID=185202 RepID=A0ACB9BWJ6_9ASTR|nr:hypothetical protein L1987_66223 [Smallanthus sonchifolius]
MASRLWTKSLTKTNRCLAAVRATPPAVQKTIIPLGQSITASFRGPSPTVFRRMYQPGYLNAPQLQIEEHKKKLKMEKEIEEASEKEKENEEQSEKGNEMEVMQPEEDMKKARKTSQIYSTHLKKILMLNVARFLTALHQNWGMQAILLS